jgi:hypothetical protein
VRIEGWRRLARCRDQRIAVTMVWAFVSWFVRTMPGGYLRADKNRSVLRTLVCVDFVVTPEPKEGPRGHIAQISLTLRAYPCVAGRYAPCSRHDLLAPAHSDTNSRPSTSQRSSRSAHRGNGGRALHRRVAGRPAAARFLPALATSQSQSLNATAPKTLTESGCGPGPTAPVTWAHGLRQLRRCVVPGF